MKWYKNFINSALYNPCAISWNQLFSNFFSENVDLTEIGERGAAWE